MMKIFYLLLVMALGVVPAQAATTNWTSVQGGAVRLISAGPIEDGHYLAGLEFSLEPGWHTYWRYPGEAGIPPQITLTEKDNLSSYQVLYPVPERYNDGFSNSIVYHDGIVLPIRIFPEDPAKPVRVSIELFFGICKEICVPGDAELTLDLSPGTEPDTLASKLINRDLAAVPGIAPAGQLEIRNVTFADPDKGFLKIEAAVGSSDAPELFAAGPLGSYIGLPVLKAAGNGTAQWHLSTKGLTTTDSDNNLRLVLTANGNALEYLAPIQPDWIQ
ncbi:protein-disulfide reductase DsbD domain-containing protein [Labrenzia sp. PHM005]|uniref:protein-disulfide reductase DsbD domain-containing protein n=1 Tax=Labrenzia sp. PHM005 TaxID=2590016 RepID=UPI001AD8A3DA|nr:protein-disulfide reductase DsbD domain-containing protein [Labrenzia sp. PHM005]